MVKWSKYACWGIVDRGKCIEIIYIYIYYFYYVIIYIKANMLAERKIYHLTI